MTSLMALCLAGCMAGPAQFAPMALENPTRVPLLDRDFVWDQVVDVVDDYFRIAREDRVRMAGDTPIEGRLDTFPEVGATLLEPWRHDSVGMYQRLESTLQTIRRYAVVRVIPSNDSFLIDVAVYKELEDLRKPEKATTGAATFRNDSSLARYNEPVGGQSLTLGWIPLGRDPALEQLILRKMQCRFGNKVYGGSQPSVMVAPCDTPPLAPGELPAPAAIDPPTRLGPLPPPR